MYKDVLKFSFGEVIWITGVPFDCLHLGYNVYSFFCSYSILLTSNMILIMNTGSWKKK